MSNKRPNKVSKMPEVIKAATPGKVKMKFKEHMYYNDLNNPMFNAGEIYELEGADWIQRWLKRGGEIVEGDLVLPKGDKPNPSALVNKQSPVANDLERDKIEPVVEVVEPKGEE